MSTTLVPTAATVPASTKNDEYHDDNDEKCGGVHLRTPRLGCRVKTVAMTLLFQRISSVVELGGGKPPMPATGIEVGGGHRIGVEAIPAAERA